MAQEHNMRVTENSVIHVDRLDNKPLPKFEEKIRRKKLLGSYGLTL
jgi:hypothetical protein